MGGGALQNVVLRRRGRTDAAPWTTGTWWFSSPTEEDRRRGRTGVALRAAMGGGDEGGASDTKEDGGRRVLRRRRKRRGRSSTDERAAAEARWEERGVLREAMIWKGGRCGPRPNARFESEEVGGLRYVVLSWHSWQRRWAWLVLSRYRSEGSSVTALAQFVVVDPKDELVFAFERQPAQSSYGSQTSARACA